MNRLDRLRLTPVSLIPRLRWPPDSLASSIELPPPDPSTEDPTDGGELPVED